jgi:pimeloyl-ACP methyl ester carboxylesterase
MTRHDRLVRRNRLVATLALVAGLSGPAWAKKEASPSTSRAAGKYAAVNGLQMYYEVHGTGRPLLLLPGGLCTIDVCFGKVIPGLARSRQVIAVEFQAHGHTADIDRPFSYEAFADDAAALLRQLGIASADVYGYSIGAAAALQLAIRHPAMVRKLVLLSPAYRSDGVHDEILKGIAAMKPENLAGSPFEKAYAATAPRPQDFPKLVARIKEMDAKPFAWPEKSIAAIKAPVLIVIGDSDIVRPEHAVSLFRLLGGGVPGDVVGLRPSQLVVLPGTTHVGLIDRADWLLSMVPTFLDAPAAKPRP